MVPRISLRPKMWMEGFLYFKLTFDAYYKVYLIYLGGNMLTLKIIGFIFLVAGMIIVYPAPKHVKKYGLDKKIKCDFQNEMNEEEVKAYKQKKAEVNLKMMGMLIMLPGLIMLLIAFK